ncbi:hypothetical protein [Plastoroseomonas hellenica]|uniref:Uncharacterized protein n=1 Tax=Plastoroseomonas hellenica TaxID=2687306 RepID=A0ABS5F156_9PROT|nr:hypothetical protein [Plastoroseomonas hellenica]MBR0646155.1 hypothetical protein [Plastoroseomonas hellenica]MBR0666291.1 hypothetical protein [Plastoroseomonas hellenica]
MSTASRIAILRAVPDIAPPRIAVPCIAAAIALAALLSWRAEAAPSLEYGPEAELRFVEACIGDPAMTPAACRSLMEGLQHRLGYAGFLEFISSEPDAAPIAIPRQAVPLDGRRWASPRLVD